jgi:uncharacterized iron-regulated protein
MWRTLGALLVGAALAGCAHRPPSATGAQWPLVLRTVLPADVLLLGEQHDDPEHQRMQHEAVKWLAIRNQLGAVVLEMAERGTSTAALPTSATPAQVQSALQWQEAAWPWDKYSPAIMEAVRAGVPVLGGNLPRTQARSAMRDQGLDQTLRPEALKRQREAIREGHCHLLAQAQVPGMARIQIARDKAMAQTLVEARRSPGATALLITGAGHTLRTAGVPVHLPKDLTVRIVVALQQKAPEPAGTPTEAQNAQPPHSQQATAEAVGRMVPADADLVWTSPWRDAPDPCEALRKQLE